MKRVRSIVEKNRFKGVVTLTVLSTLSMIFFGFLSSSKEKTTFGFVLSDEWVIVKEWVISSETGSRIFSGLALIATLLSILANRRNRSIIFPSAIASFGILMAFITWAAAGKYIPFTGLFQGRA